MPTRAKIQDVARLADVSLSTVSAVLNEKKIVSAGTRQRVLNAIEALQYRPDYYASNLARRQTRVFGLIVSDLRNPFFSETAHAIEEEARGHGYGITLRNTNFSPDLLRESVRQMLGARIAGIAIITSEYDEEAFEMVHRSGVPSVFMDVGKAGAMSTNIRVDTRQGMVAAVEHLVALGHTELLFVRNSNPGDGPALLSHKYRDQGFAAAIKGCGIPGIRTSVVNGVGFPTNAGREAVEVALRGEVFTAVVCATDLIALGVCRGLHDHGIRIPEDVSVVGFDNTYLSEFLSPPLTSIDIPREELSRLAVSALLPSDDEKRRLPQTIRLKTKLIVRSSTAPRPQTASATARANRV